MENNLVEVIKTILAESETKDFLTIEKIRRAIRNSEAVNKMPDFYSMESGESFIYRDHEWTFLGMEQGGALCITSDMFVTSAFGDSNNWKESSLRENLLRNFLPTLDEADLLPYEMDLIADNGDLSYGKSSDKIGILSCDLYRKYRETIPLYKEWVWTCTPLECSGSRVRLICSDDTIDYDVADSTGYGCVPACIFAINHN